MLFVLLQILEYINRQRWRTHIGGEPRGGGDGARGHEEVQHGSSVGGLWVRGMCQDVHLQHRRGVRRASIARAERPDLPGESVTISGLTSAPGLSYTRLCTSSTGTRPSSRCRSGWRTGKVWWLGPRLSRRLSSPRTKETLAAESIDEDSWKCHIWRTQFFRF